jgi:hypothetical protein
VVGVHWIIDGHTVLYDLIKLTPEKSGVFFLVFYTLCMCTKRYYKIAKRYRPKGVKIRFKRQFNAPSEAYAMLKQDGTKEIYTPRPDTRDGLFYFLHECAHVILRHLYLDLPIWQQEYEAEQWAIATMRREHVPVSRKMLLEAKKYVRDCIKEAGKDVKVPYRVRRWAKVTRVYNKRSKKR